MRKFIANRDHVLIGGHRGCACDFFENTIPAMKEGISRGADYLEIDLQLTGDGEIVVYHDTELSKKCRLRGYVHQHTLEELQKVLPVNTLREVFGWAARRGVCLALELKSVPVDMQKRGFELVERLAVLAEEYGVREQVFAFGADYMVLKHLKQVSPDFPIGLIVPFVPADPVKLMEDMDAMVYLSYIYNMTPEIIRDLHGAGYFVDGAILREEKWTRLARELGVDMYESDRPELEARIAGMPEGKNVIENQGNI